MNKRKKEQKNKERNEGEKSFFKGRFKQQFLIYSRSKGLFTRAGLPCQIFLVKKLAFMSGQTP